MRGKTAPEFTRLDAGLLIHKKRHDKKGFKKMVDDLRKQGFSDREILAAMAQSRELVDAIGGTISTRPVKRSRGRSQ